MVSSITIRYVMYGFPFICIFSNYPWYLKWYLTIALTDETYAIMTQDEHTGKEKQLYLFCVAFFDHCYWITGSVLGVYCMGGFARERRFDLLGQFG